MRSTITVCLAAAVLSALASSHSVPIPVDGACDCTPDSGSGTSYPNPLPPACGTATIKIENDSDPTPGKCVELPTCTEDKDCTFKVKISISNTSSSVCAVYVWRDTTLIGRANFPSPGTTLTWTNSKEVECADFTQFDVMIGDDIVASRMFICQACPAGS